MALNIIQGYNPSTTEPIDSRFVIASTAARYAIPAFNTYEGLLVYQQDTNTLYSLIDPTNIGNINGWVELGVSASYATTASYALNGGGGGSAKTYVAKLTQRAMSGDQKSGSLIIGETYTIVSRIGSDDFINVGASSNQNGITFIATNTTPTVWADQSILVSSGNPFGSIATNDFNFTPQWKRYNDNIDNHTLEGKYFFNFSSSVNPDKTAPIMMPNSSSNVLSTMETNPQLNYYADNEWHPVAFSGTVNVLAAHYTGSYLSGSVFAGGAFDTVGGSNYGYLVKIRNVTDVVDSDGFNHENYGFSDNSGAAKPGVFSLAIEQDNENILVGGTFNAYSNPTQGTLDPISIARVNIKTGLMDGPFSEYTKIRIDKSTIGLVNALAIEPSTNKIYVGGQFTESGGSDTPNNIIKLNPSGQIDSNWNYVGQEDDGGFNGIVKAIAIQSDEKVIIGGNFTTYTTLDPLDPATYTSARIIRLNADGTYDQSFAIGDGFNDQVTTIAIQPDGKILVGGYFSDYDGTRVNAITRLNSNGGIDATFNTDSGFDSGVTSIVLQPDYGILVGGVFGQYKNTSVNRIIRLSDSGSILNTFSGGIGGSGVSSIISIPYGKCMVGGQFDRTFFNNGNDSVTTYGLSKLYASYDVVLTTTNNSGSTSDNKITNTLVEVTQYT